MTFGRHIKDFFFFYQIGIEQLEEDDPKWNEREPDGPSCKHQAQECGQGTSCHEDGQHTDMQPYPAGKHFIVRMLDRFDNMDAKLTYMIRTEGGGHRNAARLPECVVLHRAQDVDRDLRDLKRGAVRNKSENDDRCDLDADQDRVPADQMMFFDRGRESFGNDGS